MPTVKPSAKHHILRRLACLIPRFKISYVGRRSGGNMKPLVTQLMVNSTGGNVDGGLTSDRSSMVADDLEELDGPILKPFTSVELMENMVAKQAAS